MNNLWFRPTALSLSNYATISREALMELYRQDNENAAKNGVSIPSRPTTATATTTLRVCQWNVHYFVQSHDNHTTTTYNRIYDELLRHNADVLVLQEFCTVDWEHENLPFLQRLQKRGGFEYTRVAATWYPTAVFVKPGMVVKAVDCIDDFALDMDRRAIVMRLTLCHVPQATTTTTTPPQQQQEGNDDTTKTRHVWIYGTHLHHVEDFPGRRYAEMQTLLRHVNQHCSADNDDAVLIVGDFNQQRSRDYTVTELNNIVANKTRRDEELVLIQDDVAATTTESTTTSDATTTDKSAAAATAHRCVTTLLEQAGFTSVWDDPSHKNWPQQEPPPATHWSGTVIDYTYARGKSLKNVGTYVSTAGWSDHRLIVTDWEFF